LHGGELRSSNLFPLNRLQPGEEQPFKALLPYLGTQAQQGLVLTIALYNEDLSQLLATGEEFLLPLSRLVEVEEAEGPMIFPLSDEANLAALAKSFDVEVHRGQILPPHANAWYLATSQGRPPKPLLTHAVPSPNTQGVDLRPVIFVGFTQPLDPNHLHETHFTLHGLDQANPGQPIRARVEVDGSLLKLTPTANLQANQRYQVRLQGNVTGLGGGDSAQDFTWSFTTRPGAATPKVLKLLAYSPKPGQRPRPEAALVQLLFDQEMPHQLEPEWIKVYGPNGMPLPGRFVVAKRKLVFQPEQKLAWESQYQVKLSGSLLSGVGNRLEEDFAYSFTTDKEPLKIIAPLKVTKVVPAPKTTGVPVSSQLLVQFDAPLAADKLPPAALQVLEEGKPIAGNLSLHQNEIAFAPLGELGYNKTYEVRLSQDLVSNAGNRLPQAVRWSFETRRKIVYPEALDPDILIFSPTHEQESWVLVKKGIMKIGVTAFDPILHLDVNGVPLKVPGGSQLEVDYPFVLQGKTTLLEVTAFTKKGKAQKTFTLHYGEKPLSADSFQLVSLLSAESTDNQNSVTESEVKTSATKGVLTLLPSYKWGITKASTLKIKSLLLREQYTDPAFQDSEVSYSQAGLEWSVSESWGSHAYEVGVSDIRTNNENLSLGKDRLSTDGYAKLSLEWKYGKAWGQSLELSSKNANTIEAASDADYETDAINLALTTALSYKAGALKTELALSYTQNDAQGQYEDSTETEPAFKVSYQLGDFTPTLNYKSKTTASQVVDPSLGVAETDQLNQTSLKLAYKPSKLTEFALTGKAKDQASNVATSVYQANLLNLTFTWIY